MKNKDKTHYQILGIKKNASIGQIKVAYRKKIAQTHPDRQENHAHSSDAWRINLAYHTLKDPKRRAEYDRRLLAQSLVAGTPLAKWADNLEGVRFDRQTLEQAARQVATHLTHNAQFIHQKAKQNLDNLTAHFQKRLDKNSEEPVELQVFAWQAMLGETITFKIDTQTLKLTLPANTQTGTLLKITNLNKPLILKITLINPATMSNEQQKIWAALKDSYQSS